MQLTKASEYGVRALMSIAKNGTKLPVNLKKIATEEKISHKFLSKILKKLEENGIVKISLGKFGGYSLAKKADEISVLDIIYAIEGQINIYKCLSKGVPCCHKNNNCRLYPVWRSAQKKFLAVLKETTLNSLL